MGRSPRLRTPERSASHRTVAMARLRSAGKDKSRISHRQASPRKRSRPTSSGPTPRSGATGRSPSSTCASRRRAACTRASRGSAAAPSARGRSRRSIRVEGAARLRASPREGPRLPALGRAKPREGRPGPWGESSRHTGRYVPWESLSGTRRRTALELLPTQVVVLFSNSMHWGRAIQTVRGPPHHSTPRSPPHEHVVRACTPIAT